ncbi:gag-pol polyprotein [Tanacetum coccineum]
MKAILRKDKCLAAIGERPAEVTDDSKWDEMDGNAITNLHLALADEVLSSIEEKKSAKEIWDHLARLYEARSLHNKIFLRGNFMLFVEALVVTRGRSMKPGSSGSHNHGKSKTGKKNNFKCFKCGKPGHFKKDCRGLNTSNPQGNIASTSEDGNALCCEAAVENESRKRFADVWLFDAGATFYMTVKREWFHQYSCNDHELKIIGIGSIMVKMHDGTVRTIQDVRHVEGLKKNLLSLGQLDDLGCKVEIQSKIVKIIKVTLVLMRGEKVAANLYQLKGEIMEEAEASVASHSPSYRVAVTWHQKLGHMSEQGMNIHVERKLLTGLIKVSLPFYEHCVISKQHRLKFKTSNSRSVCVMKLVHSDVWQAPVYPIKKKSDVFEVFKVYKARVELESGKIKFLRTDNGGEYTGDEFDTVEIVKGDEFTLSSLEVLQGFSFFLQMGFTLILATFDGLDVGLLEDVIGEDVSIWLLMLMNKGENVKMVEHCDDSTTLEG